jgi:hypothetical protein
MTLVKEMQNEHARFDAEAAFMEEPGKYQTRSGMNEAGSLRASITQRALAHVRIRAAHDMPRISLPPECTIVEATKLRKESMLAYARVGSLPAFPQPALSMRFCVHVTG